MNNRIQEIKNYILHNDVSLAFRRLLDIALDTQNATCIYKAIALSQQSRKDGTINESLQQQAFNLLQTIEQSPIASVQKNTPILQANNISKKYTHSSFALHNVSLQVMPGEIIGVVGENGNGKTTLLRLLAQQLAADNGSITYNSLVYNSTYALKQKIAFIPQRIPKWYGLLKDNLHFAAATAGIVGAENDMMVSFMLERFHLTEYAHLSWSQISSGYKTRFEIAKILLQKPSLLILDEPLANLDINAQQTVLTDLQFIASSAYQLMGIILSSQQLHEVEKIAHNVLMIKNGHCVFTTQQSTEANKSVVEIETTHTREQIVQALQAYPTYIQFNGGYYTIEAANITANTILQTLLQNNITISYFRNISHSTKRFFNTI
jgi:ABC-2 type transport system ATP-binding protein